jgi:hypothetical protein
MRATAVLWANRDGTSGFAKIDLIGKVDELKLRESVKVAEAVVLGKPMNPQARGQR